MITVHNPPGMPVPPSYHHGVAVSGDVRTLYVAGQIALAADGTIPDGIEAQARLAYANLKAVLDAAGMGVADIVKTTVFLVEPNDRAAFSAVRSEAMGDHKPASTLVYVAGLAMPELLVEVEAIAVQPVTREREPHG